MHPSNYEFPVAVVEGKPVFSLDKLHYGDSGLQTFIPDKMFPEKWSWLPPKTTTIMVELERDHGAELLNSLRVEGRLYKAISKALGEK